MLPLKGPCMHQTHQPHWLNHWCCSGRGLEDWSKVKHSNLNIGCILVRASANAFAKVSCTDVLCCRSETPVQRVCCCRCCWQTPWQPMQGMPALPLQAWHAAVSSGDLETTWDQGVFNDLIKAETKRLPKRNRNMFL